ncbi:hypothetical protein [Clavibacter tessellarius]|uniref:Secreted protein n=1 Tax=Clavibacter tessellarius TaxID=31965 RepID=A0A154V2J7_9MICO|nr:hypothetical protein [Clavibacter michiganensis]KZC95598.1 hypothetical protein AWH51_07225 [Clavibacter michiganensis subsp. tessellarius]
MHIITRAAAAVAITVSAGLPLALVAPAAAQAATESPVAATGPADSTARVALPDPQRITGTGPLTVHGTQRAVCAGTTKCVEFHGTGVPGEIVTVTYAVTRDPAYRNRGVAGLTVVAEKAHVDGSGDWALTTEFPNPVITTDAGHRGLAYHVVETPDGTAVTARFAGTIAVR